MTHRSQPTARPSGPRLSRRHALGLGAFAVAGAVAGLPLARALGRRRLLRRTLPLMGTLAEVAVVTDAGLDEAAAHEAIDAAFARLVFVDRTMSRYRADSDVGRLNAAPRDTVVAVTPETRRVLARAKDFSQATLGAFDPLLGGWTALWDVTERTAPPTVAELADAGRHAELGRHLDLAADGASIARFHDRIDLHLDLGGIAKGFAVDEAARALREAGVHRAFVNVGGDLVALGASDDGDPWRVGVRDPRDPSGTRMLRTLELTDAAVATSGTTERFFEHGGRRYHHLIDSRAAGPWATTRQSVTVRAATCMDADAGATAAFGLAARRTLTDHRWLHDRVDVLA